MYASDPGPVKNVTIDLRQGTDNVTAVLSWLPPDESNGVITQYQVFYAGYNGTQVYILLFVLLFQIRLLYVKHLVLQFYNTLKYALSSLLEAQRIG